MQDPNNPETKFFVTPDGTTYQTTVNHCVSGILKESQF
jgi:hypothetical protein